MPLLLFSLLFNTFLFSVSFFLNFSILLSVFHFKKQSQLDRPVDFRKSNLKLLLLEFCDIVIGPREC